MDFVRHLTLVGILFFGFALVACGGGSPNRGRAVSISGPTAAKIESSHSDVKVTEVAGPHGKLKLRIPSGPPPKKLVVKELRKGSGPSVESLKDEIVVNYVGLEFENGREFYNTWERGGPSKFILEETHPGWEIGLKGMRAGGIRELTTPPKFEYGTTTLIYVIEMVKVRHPRS